VSQTKVRADSDIAFYPNPARDYIIINDLNSERNSITIFNLEDKIMLTRDYYKAGQPLELDLESGLYLFKINDRKMSKLIIR
jgi:hypothetical protein